MFNGESETILKAYQKLICMYKTVILIYTYGSTGAFEVLKDSANMPSLAGA